MSLKNILIEYETNYDKNMKIFCQNMKDIHIFIDGINGKFKIDDTNKIVWSFDSILENFPWIIGLAQRSIHNIQRTPAYGSS